MRLLNTRMSEGKLELEQFEGNEIPLYAILSHVWGENEATLSGCRRGKGGEI